MRKYETMISLEGVSFRYTAAHEQLTKVSLKINAGECVVITGPSGSGKTTLTRLLNGLIPHYYEGELTGKLSLAGVLAQELANWQFGQLVGSVFQDSKTQFFSSIVQDELAFSGGNYGMMPTLLRTKLANIAEEFDLTKLLKKSVLELSSGEKQKLAVASAKVLNPDIYVLDEPSANLDSQATAILACQLRALKKAGKTIVIAEHRLHYLMPFVDRIIYLAQGQLVTEWRPESLINLPTKELLKLGLRAPDLSKVKGVPALEAVAPTVKVKVNNVSVSPKRQKVPLLTNLDFTINQGEIVALTGANGSGKTTLGKTLSGLLKMTTGQLLFDGAVVRAKTRLKKAWFVMQDSDYQLFADTVLKELLLTNVQKSKSEKVTEAEKILRSLDLWDYRDYHPAALSGGQKQRLTFGIAIMQGADIIILDEPTSGLDGRNLRRVSQLLKKLAQQGTTIIIITHDYELVMAVCQRLLQISDNRLKKAIVVNQTTGAAINKLMNPLVEKPNIN